MANKKDGDEKVSYYSAIIIDKGRRLFLFFLVFLTTLAFGSMIFENIVHQRGWFAVAIPIILLGLLYVLFPPTEHWTYQAWQSKPRMFESHSID